MQGTVSTRAPSTSKMHPGKMAARMIVNVLMPVVDSTCARKSMHCLVILKLFVVCNLQHFQLYFTYIVNYVSLGIEATVYNINSTPEKDSCC